MKDDIIKKLLSYLETDQILFIEDTTLRYIYKHDKINLYGIVDKIFLFMEEYFNVKLIKSDFNNLLNDIPNSEINKEIIYQYLIGFVYINWSKDPWIIGLLEQLTGLTKSLSISIAFLNNLIDVKQTYLLSHSEEHYQKSINGEVNY